MSFKVIDTSLVDVLQSIVQERIHQIDDEGFSYERDDQYKNGELPQAAAAYAAVASQCPTARAFKAAIPPTWPVSWDDSWWKPTDPRRDLVKAAALIVAEIQRLDRLAKTGV